MGLDIRIPLGLVFLLIGGIMFAFGSILFFFGKRHKSPDATLTHADPDPAATHRP